MSYLRSVVKQYLEQRYALIPFFQSVKLQVSSKKPYALAIHFALKPPFYNEYSGLLPQWGNNSQKRSHERAPMLKGKPASTQHRAIQCLYNIIIYPHQSDELLQNLTFKQAGLSLLTLGKALTLSEYSEGTSHRCDKTLTFVSQSSNVRFWMVNRNHCGPESRTNPPTYNRSTKTGYQIDLFFTS